VEFLKTMKIPSPEGCRRRGGFHVKRTRQSNAEPTPAFSHPSEEGIFARLFLKTPDANIQRRAGFKPAPTHTKFFVGAALKAARASNERGKRTF
jgi:hypothetical protein